MPTLLCCSKQKQRYKHSLPGEAPNDDLVCRWGRVLLSEGEEIRQKPIL